MNSKEWGMEDWEYVAKKQAQQLVGTDLVYQVKLEPPYRNFRTLIRL